MKKSYWKFNQNKVQHLAILNFIARWKFVDLEMLKQHLKISQSGIVQWMKIFIQAKVVVQKYVSKPEVGGGRISVYFATNKAYHILNKSYLSRFSFVVNVSEQEIQEIVNTWISISPETNKAEIDPANKQVTTIEPSGLRTTFSYSDFIEKVNPIISTNKEGGASANNNTTPNYIILAKLQHNKDCLFLINQMGLKDNQYLTEIELLSRYLKLRKSLNMTIRPRLCDFAYFAGNKLIGVEVERFMKSKEKYVSGEFKNNLSLTTDIADYNLIAKPNIVQWGYFDNEYQSWIPQPEFDGWNSQKVEQNKHLFGSKSFKTITKYLVTLDNGSDDYIYATSQKEAKFLYEKKIAASGMPVKALKYTAEKTDDCIFKRIYYSINHKFYDQVHWYLPKKELARFKAFLVGPNLTNQLPIYPNGLPNFIKIFDYNDVSSKIGFYPDDLKDANMRANLINKAKHLSDKEKIDKFNRLLDLQNDENAYSLFYILNEIMK